MYCHKYLIFLGVEDKVAQHWPTSFHPSTPMNRPSYLIVLIQLMQTGTCTLILMIEIVRDVLQASKLSLSLSLYKIILLPIHNKWNVFVTTPKWASEPPSHALARSLASLQLHCVAMALDLQARLQHLPPHYGRASVVQHETNHLHCLHVYDET